LPNQNQRKGNKQMSTNQKQVVKQARSFNQEELNLRLAQAEDSVMNGYVKECPALGLKWTYPAEGEQEFFVDHDLFLARIYEQALASNEPYSGCGQPLKIQGHRIYITFRKPKEELDVLIKEAKEKATQAYKDEIEAFNQAQVELLTTQLVEQELQKDRKKEEDRLAAIQAKAAAVAAEHINSQLKEVI
jgi:hypothetical protein